MTKRYIKVLVDTVATKDLNQKLANLNLPKNKIYPVRLVGDAINHWIVDLDYNAGQWFFLKSDVTFFYEGHKVLDELPKFEGGDILATIKAIVAECKRQGLTKNQCAYVLATADHESGFQPVVEAHWMSEDWRRRNLRYWPWHGRGYVQLTWKANYLKYERITGVPLTQDPSLALRPDIALFVLVHGMKTGAFTGVDLDDCISGNKCDFVGARRIINGLDRAGLIASKALGWLNRLPVY